MAKGRDKPDFYAQKAKKEGYPARSVYKLQEIQDKFQLFKKGRKVLDVGCSPGSWSLWVLRKHSGLESLVGVDLKPVTLQPHPKGQFLVGDVFSPQIQSQLTSAGPFDVIISDAAPNTTGNRTVDAGRSFSLCWEIIGLAESLLAAGGNFAIKVFQGGDEKELADRLKELFEEVKAFKPKSVRKDSFETYLVGRSRKAS
jgi:23S rRNA (uridine2552-2'-O)-methyltransferase